MSGKVQSPVGSRISRRVLLQTTAAGAAVLTLPGIIGRAQAPDPLKVAAIYTVPV